jgi:hypothetical protein
VIDGKRRSWCGRTPEEVEAKLQEAKRQARRGAPVIMPGHLTVKQYLSEWHESRLYGADSTRAQYASIIANHINPSIGAVRLTALTPDHIRRLLRDREKAGKSDRLLKYITQVLHAALEDAVRERRLEWNPAGAVQVREPLPKERRLLDWTQQADLLEAVAGDLPVRRLCAHAQLRTAAGGMFRAGLERRRLGARPAKRPPRPGEGGEGLATAAADQDGEGRGYAAGKACPRGPAGPPHPPDGRGARWRRSGATRRI